jgi:hypothetical protein
MIFLHFIIASPPADTIQIGTGEYAGSILLGALAPTFKFGERVHTPENLKRRPHKIFRVEIFTKDVRFRLNLCKAWKINSTRCKKTKYIGRRR